MSRILIATVKRFHLRHPERTGMLRAELLSRIRPAADKILFEEAVKKLEEAVAQYPQWREKNFNQAQKLEHLLPELYLHGLAKGDFELALRGLLGEGAPLSTGSIQRLKGKWQTEYKEWKQQDLSGVEVVYHWADGVYVKAGLEKDKAALLMIIGALTNGKKVLLACESGYRESKESWQGLLRDLKGRGLRLGRLTIADGHLGIWSALGEIHPEDEEQRCWNHKIRNVLDALPKRVRSEARESLGKIPYAESQKECERWRDAFVLRYQKD
jgi:transposase-like protein